MKKFNVYRQAEPTPTGERQIVFSPGQHGGRSAEIHWHIANLVRVGEAATFAEAKRLCAVPILDARRSA